MNRNIIYFLVLSVALVACSQTKEQKVATFLAKGQSAMKVDNYRKAGNYFKEATKEDPNSAKAWNAWGTAEYRQGNYYKASEYYNKAVKADPKYLKAYFNRSNAFYQLGEYYRSLSDLQVLEDHYPDSAFVYQAIGLSLSQLHQYDSADYHFGKAIKLDPNNPEHFINRAIVSYYQRNFDKALQDLEVALQMDSTQANAYNTYALIYSQKGDYNKALKFVNRALKDNPYQPFFLNNRGFIYIQLGDLEKAGQDINESLSIDPKNAWAYRNKGLYYLKKASWDDAKRMLTQAEAMNDDLDLLAYYLGELYQHTGEKEKACQYFQQSAKRGEPEGQKAVQQFCSK